MRTTTDQFLAELDELIRDFNAWQNNHDRTISDVTQFSTRMLAKIDRIAGRGSRYAKLAEEAAGQRSTHNPSPATGYHLPFLVGVLEALRADIASGYLTALHELIHADMFSDYLEMAEHLLSEGYKDPAAVLAGGTLEEHLRQLCRKHGIDIEVQAVRGTEPKMANELNTDLYKAKVYPLTNFQGVNAWIAIRNKAAHGEYTAYTKEQVDLFVQALRYFIKQYPA